MGGLAGSMFGPVGMAVGGILGGPTVSSAVLADIVATRETSLKQCADKVNDAVEKAVAADQAYADALNKIALGQVEPGDKSLSEILARFPCRRIGRTPRRSRPGGTRSRRNSNKSSLTTTARSRPRRG